MNIDDALGRLVQAYADAGFDPIRPPSEEVNKTLVAIEDAIRPLRLPAELQAFWRQVNPQTVNIGPYPALIGPEFALQVWRDHAASSPGMTPRALFPVSIESHGFMLIELSGPYGEGGTCFDWGYCGSPFTALFPSLTAYIDLLATMVELGEYRWREEALGSWWVFDPEDRWSDAQQVRLAQAMPLNRFGNQVSVEEDLRSWPDHWLLSSGLTPENRAARGATATIAELLRQASAGDEATGTIQARVTRLAGTATGSRVAVDDGTGQLDLWCPASVSAYGPVIRTSFEFDVVVRPHTGGVPDTDSAYQDVVEQGANLDLAGAQQAAMDLYATVFGSPAAAEATAVRPLD